MYWGPASTYNLSQLATRVPFSNQRAELEAVLLALQQAESRKLKNLILITDSAYAVNCLTLHRHDWQEGVTADGKDAVLTNAKGETPGNSDLFLAIFQQLRLPNCPKTFFQHVRRAFNAEADALSSAALEREKLTPTAVVAAMQTRSHTHQQSMNDLPDWQTTARFEGDDHLQQPHSWDEEDDGIIVVVSESESDEDPSQPSWHHNDELEVSSGDEDERVPELESTSVPEWTSDIIFENEIREQRNPPILRLEASWVEELLKVLVRLPKEQAEDELLKKIIEQL